MKRVILALNPLEPDSWTTHEVEDVRQFLQSQFEVWPMSARIYHEHVSLAHDVTPSNEHEVERLGELCGTFYVIVYPAEAATWIILVLAVVAAAVGYFVLTSMKTPLPASRNTTSESANNELSERINKARPLARIPDIYGQVRSTPDLIAVPYKIFIAHEEVEYCYMSIGRGYFEVDDIKDDTTRIENITGASVEVFAPFTSPNSGHEPQKRVGNAISEPLYSVSRSNAVNGQVLRPPDDDKFKGKNDVFFQGTNTIGLDGDSERDFTNKFETGDVITISNAYSYSGASEKENHTITLKPGGKFSFLQTSNSIPAKYAAVTDGRPLVLKGAFIVREVEVGPFTAEVRTDNFSGEYRVSSVTIAPSGLKYEVEFTLLNPENVSYEWNELEAEVSGIMANITVPTGSKVYDLAGTYDVVSVEPKIITLDDPVSVNPDWAYILTLPNYTTPNLSPILISSYEKWIGPFTLDVESMTEIWANFVAPNGMYLEDEDGRYRRNVTCILEATPLNPDDSPRGPAETFETVIYGSSKTRDQRASTLKALPTFTGKCSVRARRVTKKGGGFDGTVVDEVKLRDLYAVSPVTKTDFGNVTTVHAVTQATTGALAVKERKLNMLVTRKLPRRVSGSTFTNELYATKSAADSIAAACLDSYIGNRSVAEIDFDSIYDTIDEVCEYFGTVQAGEFSYTFDKDNLSFEEIMAMLAEAVFCTIYRRGSIINLSFEKETENSTLLFNHRNKLPSSETRTIRFGSENDFDGVTYKYVDPEDDAIITKYIPEDMSAVNPKEVESFGVRSHLQAYFQAWRIWNKVRYQNIITEFDATQEAELLVRKDRILVADNTRPNVQDGEVIAQNVLELTLSQPVMFSPGVQYVIFLQLVDGTVESINITPGSTSKKVILAQAPSLPLALDSDLYARAAYMIVGNTETSENAFLVDEKETNNNFTSKVKAINYDSRYYSKDKDFINNIINEEGVTI